MVLPSGDTSGTRKSAAGPAAAVRVTSNASKCTQYTSATELLVAVFCSQIMPMSCRKLVPFVTRQFSTTARRQADVVHPGYKELKVKQELFQKEDGVPVHLKKGVVDSIVYRFTMGLGVFGVGASLFSFYKLATGQK
ncbi:cytochrome c oxidase subunit 7A, mitochondrial [Macrosteles quadrilineatus]|uniref:cytochrome c oxidase subunit 7A, mitochondrial n=1 Tax=Macrosteles quadrilineatus TaxID=74068 RepID=UPI0023E1C363|nr:cytochrome c oxidase subunit 7A, mitochondrial [Macrosteles quadrilineatus]